MPLARRCVPVLLALGLAAGGVSAAVSPPPPDDPIAQNLLFISLDTTRADHLGCYGYDRPTSPCIDTLAASSHLFENAYAVMPTTLPSHSAMFTSLNPAQLTVLRNGHALPPEAHTLAERLKEHGFATGAFVAAAPLNRRLGFNQGFDAYAYPQKGDFEASIVSGKAIDWLREHSDERFFCFVHMFDPHAWYRPAFGFRREFRVLKGRYPAHRSFLGPEDVTLEEVDVAIRGYDTEIRTADFEIGRILDTLAEIGQADRTLVVFVSDHGETLGELADRFCYAFAHGEFLYRREVRIAFVLRVPRGECAAPAVHTDPVSTLDLMPTLLELLGVPCEGPAAGRSLVPVLAGGSLPPRPIITERRQMVRHEPDNPLLQGTSYSVIDGKWHWIQATGREDELYDMSLDPDEQFNVAAEHREQAEAMARMLAEWVQTNRTPAWGQDAVDVDDAELLRELQSLGYLGGDDDDEP